MIAFVFGAISGKLRSSCGENPVDWRAAALLASVVAPSMLAGVVLDRLCSKSFVQLAFATFLIVLAYPMVRVRPRIVEGSRKISRPLALLAGVVIGITAGLLGIGGTVMMRPWMTLELGLRVKTAMATSLAISIFIGVVGSAGYIAAGFGQISRLPPLIAGAVLGAWLGASTRDHLSETVLQRGFALFMVGVAL